MAEKTKEKQEKTQQKTAESKDRAKKKGGSPAKKRASFKLNTPDAREVFLAGNFNEWNPSDRPLKRNQKGDWTTTVLLAPGCYEYRFVVDGVWCDDPNATERKPNEHGTLNCVIFIGE